LAAYFKRPVSELDISFEEFCHWQAFFSLEPPDQKDDIRLAMLLERITNMSGKSVKKPVKVEDFLPKEEKKMAQTLEEQKEFFRNLKG
jgi:hypothetical protein